MSDIDTRVTGRAGRITFTRPQALNAMSHDMCLAIDTALRNWREDDAVALVVIDAVGDRAFCAGGDIAELYERGRQGDYALGDAFWRDEYRLNALIFEYPKPVVSFMQGFTMGGGVGIGCHGSHRVVEDSTLISEPECGIGLVPDAGAIYILARAPGRLGEYLGITGARMGPQDAIRAGFADYYIPRTRWADLIEMLEASGDPVHVTTHAEPPPPGLLAAQRDQIDRHFGAATLSGIVDSLRGEETDFTAAALAAIGRNSPLSMACTLQMIQQLRGPELQIRTALRVEFRFTSRSMEYGDFLEGIRAQVIDKDRAPRWRHDGFDVPEADVRAMLEPLGEDGLKFD